MNWRKVVYAYYRFLKSKLNKDTHAIKIKIAGKNWQGKYFALTDDDQYLSFTENDVFQVVRNGYVIRISSSDIQSNDLILMNKVVDN